MIACVVLPGFLATIARERASILSGQALIIYALYGRQRYVYSACAAALRAGVEPGMPLQQAMAILPEAQVLAANPPHYRDALHSVADGLALFSDHVEVEGLPQFERGWRKRRGLAASNNAACVVAYVDLGRLSVSDGLDMGRRIQRVLPGVPAMIGLAGNRFTAYAAARGLRPGKLHLVRPGDEAGFLAQRPVSLLPMDAEMARRLRLFGLRTLGAFAALPPGAVLAQFGKHGRLLQRWAQGQDERPVALLPPHRELVARHQFDDPVDELRLPVVLSVLVNQLVRQSGQTGLSPRRLQLTVTLENGEVQDAEVLLRQPLVDGAHWQLVADQLLARLRLDRRISGLAFVGTDLVAPVAQQLTLFSEMQAAPEADQALRDLIARFGPGTFLQASLTHPAALRAEDRFELDAAGAA